MSKFYANNCSKCNPIGDCTAYLLREIERLENKTDILVRMNAKLKTQKYIDGVMKAKTSLIHK
jgi:hypothetical protein